MGIRVVIAQLSNFVVESIDFLVRYLSGLCGYPENPGMSIFQPDQARRFFVSGLPEHKVGWPPYPIPQNLTQVIFGLVPKVIPIERVLYESKDGFYNFYVKNYKNLYFLPDWLSKFIQIRLNICLDISALEMVREGIFLILFCFVQMLNFRLVLFWYLTINPYTRPWIYFIGMTDWVEESLGGFVPTVLGIDVLSSVLIGIVGKIADAMNHLVFTMPFLPSEGRQAKMMINGNLEDVIVFRYLPYLWYKYPIPDQIRNFWYNERPEILRYMNRNYKQLKINFLPDHVLQQSYQDKHTLSHNIDSFKDLSAQILSKNIFESQEFIDYFVMLKQYIYHYFVVHSDKVIF